MPTEVQELTDRLLELGDKAREMRTMPREERSANWTDDIRETRDEIYTIDAELKVAEARQTAGRIAKLAELGPLAGLAGQESTGQPEFRTAGEIFTADEALAAWTKSGERRDSPGVVVERRNLLSTVAGADGGSLLPKGSPSMPTPQRRRLFLRDLIAGGSTSLASIPYVRELNPRSLELGASAVAEASAKPEVQMIFEPDDAPVRTIAAWVPVTRQAVEDIPTLRSYIDGRLGYMVELREEDEMLNGPGTGARLKGILAFTGVQTQAFTTDRPTSIGLAISKIEMVDGEADGVAINPVDFWAMATTRYANQYDGGYADRGLPYGAPPQMVWGLPTVRSRAVQLNQAIVGAWRMGAQAFDRSGVEIRVTDSHNDLFVKNQLVILAESRIALAVYRPDFFVKVPLS